MIAAADLEQMRRFVRLELLEGRLNKKGALNFYEVMDSYEAIHSESIQKPKTGNKRTGANSTRRASGRGRGKH